MPSDYPLIPLSPLKGLNLKDDKHRLQAGDLLVADNIFVNEDGSLERVDGITNILAASLGTSYCHSLIEITREDGAIEILFGYDTNLKIRTEDAQVKNLITTLSANKKCRYAFYNDRVYFGNGFDTNRVLVPSYSHLLARTTVTTADASDLATSITLINALKTDYNTHRQSTTEHNAADSTNTTTSTDATDLASSITLANEIKTDYNAHRSQAGVHVTADSYHLVEAAASSDLATLITLVNQIKLCYNQHIQDTRCTLWTIPVPTTAPTVAAAAGAGLGIGAYSYYFTFYDPVNAEETAPSPLATVTTTSGNQLVNITNIEKSTDPKGRQKRIYRTTVGEAVFYRVTTITNVTTSYADTTPDASLGAACVTENFTIVPNTSINVLYNDRTYMSGDFTNPFRVYYSEALYPHFYNEAYNRMDFAVTVTAITPISVGLLVFEKYKTWLLAGTNPSNFTRILLSETIGANSQEGVAYVGKDTVVFVSEFGIYMTNGSTFEALSKNIDPVLLAENLDDAFLVYDVLNSRLYFGYAEA